MKSQSRLIIFLSIFSSFFSLWYIFIHSFTMLTHHDILCWVHKRELCFYIVNHYLVYDMWLSLWEKLFSYTEIYHVINQYWRNFLHWKNCFASSTFLSHCTLGGANKNFPTEIEWIKLKLQFYSNWKFDTIIEHDFSQSLFVRIDRESKFDFFATFFHTLFFRPSPS